MLIERSEVFDSLLHSIDQCISPLIKLLGHELAYLYDRETERSLILL